MSHPERVALCVTCLVDQVMPEVGTATVRLLQRAGYEVDFPERQTCCGQPFFNSGFLKEARRLARRTIDAFAGQPAVVLPSGSCTTMIRKEYPHLFEDEPRYLYRARRLAAKTYELSEFLVYKAQWQPAKKAGAPSVTYHDSCHMCRLLGLRGEPRLLLAQAGCQIREMNEPDQCCGFGGLFSLRMPGVSNAMTAGKLEQGAETGAQKMVTADPGCLMQMQGLDDENGPQCVHLAVLLEEMSP